MAGITLAEAESKLDEYQTAETKVLASQAYSIGGRSMTRADLGDIREGIEFWDGKCQELDENRTSISIRGITGADV